MKSLLIKSLFQRLPRAISQFSRRIHNRDLCYDLSEDIMFTTYEKIALIGINSPSTSNTLNDNMLVKLNHRLKEFDENDEFSVAILHGVGSNFCTGIQETASKENAKKVIKTMEKLRKPTIATMTGFTSFFGFHLALMCDLRVMEQGANCGFGHKLSKHEIDMDTCKRLLKLTNLTAALDLALTGGPLNNIIAASYGLINRTAEKGTGLAASISLAQCLAKYPLEQILLQRQLVLSLYLKNDNKED